jgi:hypothetical protein
VAKKLLSAPSQCRTASLSIKTRKLASRQAGGRGVRRTAGENLFFQWGVSYLFFSKILIFSAAGWFNVTNSWSH